MWLGKFMKISVIYLVQHNRETNIKSQPIRLSKKVVFSNTEKWDFGKTPLSLAVHIQVVQVTDNSDKLHPAWGHAQLLILHVSDFLEQFEAIYSYYTKVCCDILITLYGMFWMIVS
jgi:hypothetical protein